MKSVKYRYFVSLEGSALENPPSMALKLPADSFREALSEAFPQWIVVGAHESYEEWKKALDNGNVVATVSYVDIGDREQRMTYTVRRSGP